MSLSPHPHMEKCQPSKTALKKLIVVTQYWLSPFYIHYPHTFSAFYILRQKCWGDGIQVSGGQEETWKIPNKVGPIFNIYI